jgi:NADH-quinone oxidoreductase subunit C
MSSGKDQKGAIQVEPLAIAKKIQEKFPEDVIDIKEFRGQVGVLVKKDRIEDICR